MLTLALFGLCLSGSSHSSSPSTLHEFAYPQTAVRQLEALPPSAFQGPATDEATLAMLHPAIHADTNWGEAAGKACLLIACVGGCILLIWLAGGISKS